MAEEIIKNSESSQEGAGTGTEFDPVAAINDIKANTVPKEDYEKVKAERDKYCKALIEGTQVVEEKKEPVDIDALRKDLFSEDSDLSNLEYVKKAVALRDALIDEEGVDIFVAKGNKLAPTDEDYEAAERVAQAYKHCIEVADGDSEIFTRELMRITQDVGPKINTKIRR